MSKTKPEKKQRLMETNGVSSDPVKNSICPKPIVGLEFIEEIPLREAFVGVLKQKKDIAIAIKSIASILPGFGYLKRCSGNRLLLAYVRKQEENLNPSFESTEDLTKFLIEKNFNLNIFKDNFEFSRIPERSPRTKFQFTKACEVWPVHFHPDNNIEAMMSGNFFNSVQLQAIETCMRICIEAAEKSAIGNEHCNGSALIFNPNDDGLGKILAISTARVNEHPMWHAAMIAIDLIAKIRGGGAWKFDLSTDEIHKNIRKREFSSNLPLFYPESLKSIKIPEFENFLVSKLQNKFQDDEKNCPYLCTNYWVFLLKEPCPLCAMALLHSRVSMIFYGTSNNLRGVLGTKSLFHTLSGLNHRYKVWSGILEDECKIIDENLVLVSQ